jgi:branched-subunit amino acid transport protein
MLKYQISWMSVQWEPSFSMRDITKLFAILRTRLKIVPITHLDAVLLQIILLKSFHFADTAWKWFLDIYGYMICAAIAEEL